jgi:hypothetical protein
MRPDQVPTLFVALVLVPDQFELFEEIGAEAIDIFDEDASVSSSVVSGGKQLILLDRDHMRMALAWTATPAGDVLSLAIGAVPGQSISADAARMAADMLRELESRASALFEVRRALWQITLLPLDAAALKNHARQQGIFDPRVGNQVGSPFFTVEPDRKPVAVAARSRKASRDLLAAAMPKLAEANWTKQASALALSTTFVLVTPPVGIAMLAYAALRQGKDMDLLPRDLEISLPAPAYASRQS